MQVGWPLSKPITSVELYLIALTLLTGTSDSLASSVATFATILSGQTLRWWPILSQWKQKVGRFLYPTACLIWSPGRRGESTSVVCFNGFVKSISTHTLANQPLVLASLYPSILIRRPMSPATARRRYWLQYSPSRQRNWIETGAVTISSINGWKFELQGIMLSTKLWKVQDPLWWHSSYPPHKRTWKWRNPWLYYNYRLVSIA